MAAEPHTLDSLVERVRRDGVRRTAAALRKPPVSSRLLQELSELAEPPEARAFVAAYSLSPGHLLELLAESTKDAEIWTLLASNPRTPPHLLSRFASHNEARVRAEVAVHPQLPPREMPALAEDPALQVRRALASNPELRLPIQAMLAMDPDPSVRLALSMLPTLSPQAALVLGSDQSAVVRVQVVSASKVDEDLLQAWACSDEEELQLALCRRKELSPKVWRFLLRSPHASVRAIALEALDPDEVDLLWLVSEGSLQERVRVAGRPGLCRPLQHLLAQDPSTEVRTALAGNESLDPDVAAFFVSEGSDEICVSLAANPSLSTSLVQALAALRSPAVMSALAYRNDLGHELPALLVAHSSDFRRHWAAQARPASGLDEQTARSLLADPLPQVRVLAVSGGHWRRADLYDLVRDPVARVRQAVLRHPNAPDELLEDLCRDTEPELATEARELLDRRRRQARSEGLARQAIQPAEARVAPAPSLVHDAPHNREPSSQDPGLLGKLKRLFFR